MSSKLVLIVVLLGMVASVLVGCGGNVADGQAVCNGYNQHFEKNDKGTPMPSPVDCEHMKKGAAQVALSSIEVRVSSVCLDVAAQANSGKAIVNKTNDGKYALKWVNQFGSGYQDCSTAVRWETFADAYKAKRVVLQ
jgi:hypothetical protein